MGAGMTVEGRPMGAGMTVEDGRWAQEGRLRAAGGRRKDGCGRPLGAGMTVGAAGKGSFYMRLP